MGTRRYRRSAPDGVAAQAVNRRTDIAFRPQVERGMVQLMDARTWSIIDTQVSHHKFASTKQLILVQDLLRTP